MKQDSSQHGLRINENLDDLRKIVEAAQDVLPEPWIVMDSESLHVAVVEQSRRDGSIISGGTVADAGHVAFRDHIATFDPPTTLHLLDRLVQAEQERDAALEANKRWAHRSSRETSELFKSNSAIRRVSTMFEGVTIDHGNGATENINESIRATIKGGEPNE